MSRIKTHVKKGDQVVVTSGAFRGAQGIIIEVQPSKGRVLIEGVRMIKKCVKPSQERPNGGIIEKEGPIHISNVKLAAAAPAKDEGKKDKARAKTPAKKKASK